MILSEMKKFLFYIAVLIYSIGVSNAAVRDGTAISRNNANQKPSQVRTATNPKRRSDVRTQSALISRPHANTKTTSLSQTSGTKPRTATARTITARPISSTKVISRNTTTINSASETRTGTEYENCKNTYFACMDQFCTLKNDAYRRCSCNDRVFNLDKARQTLSDAGEQLTTFNENLQVVGMTAAQATSMRTSSEGEDALTADKSASKALLEAIMNSIRGEDTNVSGKLSSLNSINISFDTSGALDTIGAGQSIANYNGQALYNAVYPQCRDAVRADCNDASLQRAITAYLMAIEQDCNTVQTAIDNTQKQIQSAIREGSAMLDLARIENRQKHNSSDLSACINAVETTILSEEVCGANYHKCLDNGEFINIDTGAPIVGIKDFFKLDQSLSFTPGIDAVHQKLAQNPNNRKFVENFVNRTKKFATPALDTCVEIADTVWSEYLDKAMLSIYYAQKDKVTEVKQNCFNYISECYINNKTTFDNATKNLSDDKNTIIQPDKLVLNSQMCSDYIESCNNMFDNNIIAEYIAARDETDTIAACRAVTKQCFDKFGGKNYENLFYPNSGLFEQGRAIDWFTLYTYKHDGTNLVRQEGYVSQCAQQLTKIDACNSPEIIEQVFGGMDSFITNGFLKYSFYTSANNPTITNASGAVCDNTGKQITDVSQCDCKKNETNASYYGCINNLPTYNYGLLSEDNKLLHRQKRPTGVATEVYNNIISYLTTQCNNKQGRFLERQSFTFSDAMPYKKDVCAYTRTGTGTTSSHYLQWLENICPAKHSASVDTASWGMCSCWHNGGRRSRWGTTEQCLPILPVMYPQICTQDDIDNGLYMCSALNTIRYNEANVPFIKYEEKINDAACSTITFATNPNDKADIYARLLGGWGEGKLTEYWCTQDQISNDNQVCSYTGTNENGLCNPVPILSTDQIYDSSNPNQTINVDALVPVGK